jgi:hypothetical protein
MRPEMPVVLAFLLLVAFSLAVFVVLWLKRVNVIRRTALWYYQIFYWTLIVFGVATARIVNDGNAKFEPALLVWAAPGLLVALGVWLYYRFEGNATYLLYNVDKGHVDALNELVGRRILDGNGPWVVKRDLSRLVLTLRKGDKVRSKEIRRELNAYIATNGKRSVVVLLGACGWLVVAVGCVALLVAGSV